MARRYPSGRSGYAQQVVDVLLRGGYQLRQQVGLRYVPIVEMSVQFPDCAELVLQKYAISVAVHQVMYHDGAPHFVAVAEQVVLYSDGLNDVVNGDPQHFTRDSALAFQEETFRQAPVFPHYTNALLKCHGAVS